MRNYESILGAAEQLPPEDRLRLIEALWNSVPPESELPLHADWEQELVRRVGDVVQGTAPTLAWSKIREEALERIGYGS